MPRPKQHADPAARQAAYRNRVYWQQPPTQKFLAGMALGLHQDLREALQKGTCPLPAELLGEHAGQTLLKLRDYLSDGGPQASQSKMPTRNEHPEGAS